MPQDFDPIGDRVELPVGGDHWDEPFDDCDAEPEDNVQTHWDENSGNKTQAWPEGQSFQLA